MNRVLIVEDEEHIARGLRFNLEAEGYSVEVAGTAKGALQRLLQNKEHFDVLVLDVMLPDKDGFSVARELRTSQNYVPVLMLTARGRPEDVLQGFDAGADDYLPKPFDLDILIARIGGLLRRKNWLQTTQMPPTPPVESSDTFSFGGKVVDFQKLQLTAGSRTIQLTLMEAELLRYLIKNGGRPVSRKEILEDVWNLREDTDTRAIDNFIVRLRRHIEAEPSTPRHLLTVRGLGYQFVPNPQEK
ncbi:MAG TPA: response regulator transcription factor [Candidatus Angelobacter sp.]|nr:response regulator transcription factor [Candidatus Angelobacter sp.]